MPYYRQRHLSDIHDEKSLLPKFLIALAITAFVGWLVVAPFWAVFRLQHAVQQADIDEVESCVDFPALRASLKDQMNAQVSQAMMNGEQNSGFVALGAMFATTVMGRMIDTMITPKGIINMARGQNPDVPRDVSEFANLLSSNSKLSYAFEASDRFVVRVRGANPSFKLVWRRSGLATWRLSAIDLSPNALSGD